MVKAYKKHVTDLKAPPTGNKKAPEPKAFIKLLDPYLANDSRVKGIPKVSEVGKDY
jgi:hypothetical protein